MAGGAHNDVPTTVDRMEWAAEVARLNERIRSCKLPHVLGIHGDWGSGKTSFMRQVQRSLGAELPRDFSVDTTGPTLEKATQRSLQKEVITVWFDAWRYQNEPVPIVALLHELRKQLALVPSVIIQMRKLGAVTAYGLLDGLSDIGKILSLEGLPSAEKIEARGERWEKENFASSLDINSLREHLCKTIEKLLPKSTSRVAIFIDDLDRCNPKAAVRLMEGLKIYLSIPNCVFVIGMNERVLVDAIRDELPMASSGTTTDSTLRAGHYLEKICSDIYRVISPSSPLDFFATWIDDFEQRHSLLLALGDHQCMPPNPRRLKALANQWPRFASRVPFPRDDIPAQKIWAVRVFISIYIHQSHRDLWERWHFSPDFWTEILAWCNGDRENELPHNRPRWAADLQLTHFIKGYDDAGANAVFASRFPNPGDIENFWIGSLVREYRDDLAPTDFTLLLGRRLAVNQE